MAELDLLELILRVAAAAGAGIAIGFEREVGDHVAGIRTHTLVAVGAAMFAIGGAYGFADIVRLPPADPARVAAQVASGIGFVGAGAIVKDGMVVRGLTTAATLWLSAALGMTGGAGAYIPLAVGLLIVMMVLTALRIVKPAARGLVRRRPVLAVSGRLDGGALDRLLREVEVSGAKVERLSIQDDAGGEHAGGRRVVLRLRYSDHGQAVASLEWLSQLPEVRQLSLGPESHLPRLRRVFTLRGLVRRRRRDAD